MLKDFSISLRFSRNDGDFLNLSLIEVSFRKNKGLGMIGIREIVIAKPIFHRMKQS